MLLVFAGAAVSFGVLRLMPDGMASPKGHDRFVSDGPLESVPEQVAEAFFKHWIDGNFAAAEALTTGRAREAVDRRMSASPSAPGATVSEAIDLSISEFANLPGGALELLARATGEVSGVPYHRALTFRLEEKDGRWRVEDMQVVGDPESTDELAPPGAVTHDPSQFEMRGDDVP